MRRGEESGGEERRAEERKGSVKDGVTLPGTIADTSKPPVSSIHRMLDCSFGSTAGMKYTLPGNS